MKSGLIAALAVVGGLVAILVLAWVVFLGGLIGPGNVRDQWRFAYDYDEDLRAIARQVCDAEALAASSTGSAKVQRDSQAQAIRLNYQRVAGDYNGRLRDAFRAGVIRPADVPDRAPTLADMRLQECL